LARKLVVAGTFAALFAFCSIAVAGQAGSGPRLTAKVTPQDIDLGNATEVAGRLTGAPAGDGGQALTVFAKPYPYESEQVAGTVVTNPTGRYSLEVEPRLNTRYVVRATADPTIESANDPTAWVYPKKIGTVAKFIRPGLASGRMILRVDPNHPFRFEDRPLFFYFRKKGSKVFERVARTETRLRRPGDVTGFAKFKIPRGNYTFVVTWCFDPGRKDFGVGRPVREKCPRRRFRGGSLSKLAEPPPPGPEDIATAR